MARLRLLLAASCLAVSQSADVGRTVRRVVVAVGLDVAVRCPDGARLRARLAAGAPLAALFDLVEARWAEAEGGPLLPDAFRLASAFPRRVFERPADGGGALHEAMEAAGLGGGQVALSLEA